MPDLAITVRDTTAEGTKPIAPTAVTQKDGVSQLQLSTEKPIVEPKPADRPAWLPEKFKTPEDMARSYGELEKKLGTPKPDATPAPDSVPQVKTAADATKAIADAGLDMSALRTEFATNGKLSDATYTALEAKKISRGDADAYIAGQQAIVREYTASLVEYVGGKDKMAVILEWAGTNVDAAEAATINKTLVGGDAALSKTVLAGLKARYDAAVGVDPSLVTGAGAPRNAGAQMFQSNAEVVAAMRDPRYRKDEAYRKQVAARMPSNFHQ